MLLHYQNRMKFPDALAMQYDGSHASIAALRELIPSAVVNGPVGYGEHVMIDGHLHAKGDWVVKNNSGHYHVLSENDFQAEYEPK